MKCTKTVFILLLLMHFLADRALAQTPNNNRPVIEYKWADGQVSGVMPFDEDFLIKITGMPTGIEKLSVTLYEIRKNYRLFSIKGKHPRAVDTISYDRFIAMPVIKKYYMKDWVQQPDKTDTFAFIPQPYPLFPNSQYVIEITAHTAKELNDDAKNELTDKLQKSVAIRAVFSGIAGKYVNLGKSQKEFVAFIKDFNAAVNAEIKKVNANYVFKTPPDEMAQLNDVRGFVNTYLDLLRKTGNLAANKKDTSSRIKANAEHATTLSGVLKQVDIGDYIFDPGNRNDLDDPLNKIARTGSSAAYDATIDTVVKRAGQLVEFGNNILQKVTGALVEDNTYEITLLGGNYPVAMTDQANNYLGLDFGLAYVGNFSRLQSYYGVNVYFRPVNKNIPLSRYHSFGDIMGTRASLLLGITFASIEKDNVRKGVLADKGLLLGAGFRLVSFLRVQGGGLLYYRYPQNPLINRDNYSMKVSPFVAFSFDMDMQSLLGVFGSSLFPPKTSTAATP